MAKYCKYCGEPVGANTKYCGKCGAPVVVKNNPSGNGKWFRICALALVMVLIILLFSRCGGGSVEDNLVGSWYLERNGSHMFTLYDDGTCKIDGEYGTGTWAVVNENKLKLSNFYGSTQVVEIVDVSRDMLVVGDDDSTQTLVKGD